VLEAFFEDAREALDGARPVPPEGQAPTANAADGAGGNAGNQFAWSRRISADALATEVKRVASGLAKPLASAAAFKSGGHEECGAVFSLLAVLFAVIDEYDGKVRWQADAAALREAFARAAIACEAPSDDSFAEATERRRELDDLIRGGRADARAAGAVDKWSALAKRSALMQRMEIGLEERIGPHLSDARGLKRAAADVQHEAEVLALLAEIIRREEYEFWDDETFNGYAEELGAASSELARAAAANDYEAARAAAGRLSRACATCHDGYRG
jgi:cytochrome c556